MVIRSIELNNYRNYKDLCINFSDGTNILYGDNAQGKTNILEAAYISGTTKSHKGSKDRELIKFDENESHIRTIIEKDEKEYQIDIHLRKNKSKGIAINKIPIKKTSELFGLLNIIFFSPEDLNIIKNGPQERRRFIDAELCQLDKIYLHNLKKYNKILEQRNKLLKDISLNPELKDTLTVWDAQLIEYGSMIIKSRKDFIDKLNEIVHDMHFKISGGKEDLLVEYEPNVTANNMEMELLRATDRDLHLGNTSVGPHRDDLKFSISGIDIRRYGSQGQQRTCALSLKLSEIQLVEMIIGEKPVLLLDDVLSELDSNRQNYLLNSIYDTQTIITCTGLDDFVKNRFKINRVYEVIQGQVFERSSTN